ncbi:MAG: DoxX family protein [Flavobacteriaceae bacterium]
MMKYLRIVLKGVVSLTILNVWIVRVNKKSIYRGGDSTDLITEFASYGLSVNTMYVIGIIKVVAALFLLISIFNKKLEFIPLVTIAALMIGAIYFHFSIDDTLIKSMPAALMLTFSLAIYLIKPVE